MPWYRTTPAAGAIGAVAAGADEESFETAAERVWKDVIGNVDSEWRGRDPTVLAGAGNAGSACFELVHSTTHVSLRFPAATRQKTSCPDCSAQSVPSY